VTDYVAPDLSEWTQWFPDGYPIRDKFHNPWIPIDPISGLTAFSVWAQDRSVTEEQFRAKLDSIVNGEPWDSHHLAPASYADGIGSNAPSAGGSYIDRLIARARADGAKESSSSHEMPMVQRGSNNGSHEAADASPAEAFSGEHSASARDRAARVFPALAPDDSGSGEKMMWSRTQTAIGAKCKECDRIIASGDAATSGDVFATARIHAEREGHTVVIRQVQRIEVSPLTACADAC
jgi:hypothetical protein